MARRHEIQNLQRRGNVYYWRSRIPSRIGSPGGEERLSLSLRLSDHIKAGYMARRLNTLLHELKLRPNVMTTTKDQLAALFRAEIERMLAHLDELALMARRFGNADDPGQLDADLEVGWAYRLLQLFGSRKPLSFEDGCPGRALWRPTPGTGDGNGFPEIVSNSLATCLLGVPMHCRPSKMATAPQSAGDWCKEERDAGDGPDHVEGRTRWERRLSGGRP